MKVIANISANRSRSSAFFGSDEHPWNQSPALERGDIGPLGALITGTAGDIRPHRW
jgi:hypothetical protein